MSFSYVLEESKINLKEARNGFLSLSVRVEMAMMKYISSQEVIPELLRLTP